MAKIPYRRVGEQIKKEFSQLIQTELKDPRIGFITVTGVEVTNDLSQAKSISECTSATMSRRRITLEGVWKKRVAFFVPSWANGFVSGMFRS